MRRNQQLVTAAAAALLVAASLSAMAGCIPFDWIVPWAGKIRHPDDVTPERYVRYLHVCWFFAVGTAVMGGYLLRRKALAAHFIATLLSDLRSALGGWKLKGGRDSWLTLTLIILGGGLRLSDLPQPMAYDESYSYVNFASQPLHLALGDYNSTNNHLFNTLLMLVCDRLFGQREWALRLPVLTFAVALLPAVWMWSRRWFGPLHAWLTLAMVAVSPLLMTYSVDARGYMYVACAAIVLDASLAAVHEGTQRWSLAWVAAWGAVVIGCWSMPLMIYPLAGVLSWFVILAGWGRENRTGKPGERLKQLCVAGWPAAVAVAVLYAPSYIFRGMLFLSDPIVARAEGPEFLRALGPVWGKAFLWWFEGPVPWPVWLLLLVLGLAWLPRNRMVWVRMLCPFAAVLLLMTTQRVTPPPRIFLFLAPWSYLIVSHAVVTAAGWLPRSGRAVQLTAAALAVAGLVYAVTHPVLIDAGERLSYLSVPDVIAHIDQTRKREPSAAQRLIAPLPCDLPSIFYMEQRGFRIPVNGEPVPGEMIWLIARHHETPADVLSSSLVDLTEWTDRIEPWQRVVDFQTLTLYRSTVTETGGTE